MSLQLLAVLLSVPREKILRETIWQGLWSEKNEIVNKYSKNQITKGNVRCSSELSCTWANFGVRSPRLYARKRDNVE